MAFEKKKLMLLGGLRYLIPVIETAHELGIHVITVDYLPDNIAHKYSDEYHNVSIIDKQEVLKLAQELDIDGIMSFAVDPGVVTAAYVAEKLGLPFQGSYNSVSILQDKSKFRAFLQENGFNVPKAKGYKDLASAIDDMNNWTYPVIVKPVDSAGSKGVARVDSPNNLAEAFKKAQKESHKGEVIIEEFIEKDGCSSDSDSFTVNGILKVCTFSDQYFDTKAENPYTPSAYSWPSSMAQRSQEELRSELPRLMTLLDMKTGIYNIETRLGKNGKTYIMEVSPRGGGNRLAEMTDLAYKTNLLENAIRSAVNMPLLQTDQPIYEDNLVELVIHADKMGIFEKIEIQDSVKPYLIQEDVWVNPGEYVSDFKGANNSLGTLVFRFPNQEGKKASPANHEHYYKVKLK